MYCKYPARPMPVLLLCNSRFIRLSDIMPYCCGLFQGCLLSTSRDRGLPADAMDTDSPYPWLLYEP